jgi:ABC-2 type transport system ATP-binding protein
MADMAITATGLRKSYGGSEVVRGIDLAVASGEVFGFLGPNGAGKTTTIEILEGYRERSGGEVSVLGVDPGRPTREWRDRVGLVLQECEMNPVLTVRENVALFSSFFAAPRSVDETVELVGLGSKRDARVATLSGGQKRRLDVACGIIGDPELIFLDEPTTGFDPSARRDAWTMIEGLKALGKTVFLTTHYMDEAQQLADRVAILRAGSIVAQGAPAALGDSLGRRAEIRFQLPAGAAAEGVRTAVGRDLALDGNAVSFPSEDPQRDLYALLSWAERERLALGDLEVARPSLEDVFLELTAEEAP